ncbi:MAG: sigma-54 interaction domain-containing protein, partial [bacterium]
SLRKTGMPPSCSHSSQPATALILIIMTIPDADRNRIVEETSKSGLPKPLVIPDEEEELIRRFNLALRSAYILKELKAVKTSLKERFNFDQIITRSPLIEEQLERIKRVVRSRVPVLILGESGVGKELVARMIHFTGDRSRKPFVVVNCAAIPESLLESQFFGYEKGAFTGAVSRTAGKLEAASGGTLFLDEIGEMNPYIQAKLLRVLEYGEFERVGGTETIKVDVRFITATNRDLEKMMEEGHFRSDLYFRICVYPIRLPPLRARKEDIPLLVYNFLLASSARNRIRVWLIDDEAMEMLTRYPWPGNVRELENAVERAVLLSDGVVLTVDNFPTQKEWWLLQQDTEKSPSQLGEDNFSGGIKPLFEVEKEAIVQALKITGGNVPLAALHLGIGKSTLYRKIQEYQIEI